MLARAIREGRAADLKRHVALIVATGSARQVRMQLAGGKARAKAGNGKA